LLLNNNGKTVTVFRAILVLPWIISPVLAAIMWKVILNPTIGAGASVLGVLEGNGYTPVHTFGTSLSAFISLMLVSVWILFPFGTVLTLGALKTIPLDLYEAAAVDGATWWRRFWHITIPGLKNTLLVVVIFFSLRLFTSAEIPLVLTG